MHNVDKVVNRVICSGPHQVPEERSVVVQEVYDNVLRAVVWVLQDNET